MAIGVIVLKVLGYIAWSWLTVGIIAAALLLIPGLLTGTLFGTLFKSNNANTNDPLQIDACGCGPGQTVSLSRRSIWGKWKDGGTADCGTALSRVKGSGRWRMNGCVN